MEQDTRAVEQQYYLVYLRWKIQNSGEGNFGNKIQSIVVNYNQMQNLLKSLEFQNVFV